MDSASRNVLNTNDETVRTGVGRRLCLTNATAAMFTFNYQTGAGILSTPTSAACLCYRRTSPLARFIYYLALKMSPIITLTLSPIVDHKSLAAYLPCVSSITKKTANIQAVHCDRFPPVTPAVGN
ncbi:hypothetical protein EVAR_34333_1 [Eumeta japonica]|uniref:Uncharacterized protein n=1 Tax=Eumeta variegata TaxID=151549 RepID=A0A4C1VDH7_EUMVA|nr:hypothetical protein EVAR_34333_1 [Eumeta japonica]